MDKERIRRTIVSLTEIDKYKRERLILSGANNTLQLTETEYQDLNLSCNFRLKTIADLIKEEEDKQCTLKFGVQEIDSLFQYNDDITRTTLIADEFMESIGLPLKSIVEITGILGIGKTSLCLQLALNIQIPSSENDFVPNQTVYIELMKCIRG
ncbi:hypothetical protein K502DRAFT_202549 [Neoconidiobolus thromboides FSU 785]|nr:hypothetical protein K502DRAFT_202549 [Neoconidiobolus thromboides FSU 785]